jgi:hypothetical protein
MVEIAVMVMCVGAGMALSYIVWWIATENGLR